MLFVCIIITHLWTYVLPLKISVNTRVRLVGGRTGAEGRVEVFHDGRWGTVCDVGWDLDDAAMVCKALDYSCATVALGGSGSGSSHDFGYGTGDIFLAGLDCSSDASSLEDCEFPGFGDHWFCNHHQDAGVRCSSECNYNQNPEEDTFRLAGGRKPSEGRVEVYKEGRWGTVCDDFWGLDEATMVCRTLGYSYAIQAYKGPGASWGNKHNFGQGSGNILLDNVNCPPDATTLKDCTYNDWLNVGSCTHKEDAGLECHY